MEQVTISLSSELKEGMYRALSSMNLTLEEFLELTFPVESKALETEKKPMMVDLFQGYEDDYQGESYDWGSPVGREIW